MENVFFVNILKDVNILYDLSDKGILSSDKASMGGSRTPPFHLVLVYAVMLPSMVTEHFFCVIYTDIIS